MRAFVLSGPRRGSVEEVSAPVAGPSGRVGAALTLMAPAARARSRRDELVMLTREAAARIDRTLGGIEETAA